MNNYHICIKENPEYLENSAGTMIAKDEIIDWVDITVRYRILAVGPPPGTFGQLEFPFVIDVEMQNEQKL